MSEENIYHCSCGCGCKYEVDEDGEVCSECLETCFTQSNQQNNSENSEEIKYGFCVFCGQHLDEDSSHCGEKCLEKCRRHDCLWLCDKCGECCCFCECKNID